MADKAPRNRTAAEDPATSRFLATLSQADPTIRSIVRAAAAGRAASLLATADGSHVSEILRRLRDRLEEADRTSEGATADLPKRIRNALSGGAIGTATLAGRLPGFGTADAETLALLATASRTTQGGVLLGPRGRDGRRPATFYKVDAKNLPPVELLEDLARYNVRAAEVWRETLRGAGQTPARTSGKAAPARRGTAPEATGNPESPDSVRKSPDAAAGAKGGPPAVAEDGFLILSEMARLEGRVPAGFDLLRRGVPIEQVAARLNMELPDLTSMIRDGLRSVDRSTGGAVTRVANTVRDAVGGRSAGLAHVRQALGTVTFTGDVLAVVATMNEGHPTGVLLRPFSGGRRRGMMFHPAWDVASPLVVAEHEGVFQSETARIEARFGSRRTIPAPSARRPGRNGTGAATPLSAPSRPAKVLSATGADISGLDPVDQALLRLSLETPLRPSAPEVRALVKPAAFERSLRRLREQGLVWFERGRKGGFVPKGERIRNAIANLPAPVGSQACAHAPEPNAHSDATMTKSGPEPEPMREGGDSRDANPFSISVPDALAKRIVRLQERLGAKSPEAAIEMALRTAEGASPHRGRSGTAPRGLVDGAGNSLPTTRQNPERLRSLVERAVLANGRRAVGDSIAALIATLRSEGAASSTSGNHRGRPPIRGSAMTEAERARRVRARQVVTEAVGRHLGPSWAATVEEVLRRTDPEEVMDAVRQVAIAMANPMPRTREESAAAARSLPPNAHPRSLVDVMVRIQPENRPRGGAVMDDDTYEERMERIEDEVGAGDSIDCGNVEPIDALAGRFLSYLGEHLGEGQSVAPADAADPDAGRVKVAGVLWRGLEAGGWEGESLPKPKALKLPKPRTGVEADLGEIIERFLKELSREALIDDCLLGAKVADELRDAVTEGFTFSESSAPRLG